MGNHSTRHNDKLEQKHIHSASTTNYKVSKSISRSTSSNEIEQNFTTHFLPIDKLSKILAEHSEYEESVHHGISENVFIKYLFPHYPQLGSRLFKYLLASSQKVSSKYLGTSTFKQEVEKLLSLMNDQIILDTYVKIYCHSYENSNMTPETLKELLMISYQSATESEPNTCPYILETINTVITSCFHGKKNLSICYVSNWLSQHCPRVVSGVHKAIVHVFTIAYRYSKKLLSTGELQLRVESVTPVLEKAVFFDKPENLLPLSHVWLLSISLPLTYIQTEDSSPENNMAKTLPISRSPCPSHWTLLYSSDEHGTGANRFLHHVLGYRGPTIVIIKGDNGSNGHATYCICNAVEWRESHLYWGDADSVILELYPTYKIFQKKSKILYLNTGIRGYPYGLRAGDDPRNPIINIDQSFHSINFEGAPHRITSIEVWGCGDRKSRERQLEVKKWQLQEVEKQRVVKLSPNDWLDHPDRYLLELAGRQSYNNASS
ncbi:uncharacterized protein LOC141534712 [Cotesia typhae]|uniref:uncharacterized protein LOC141534712 n=1 Tax=Cotesia typhae TaxID=2053667 RepID=UPI003D685A20